MQPKAPPAAVGQPGGFSPLVHLALIKRRSLPYDNALKLILVKIKEVFRSKSGPLPARKWVCGCPFGHGTSLLSRDPDCFLSEEKPPLLAPQR